MKITINQLKYLIRESIKEIKQEPYQLNASDPKDAEIMDFMKKNLKVDPNSEDEIYQMIDLMNRIGMNTNKPYNMNNLKELQDILGHYSVNSVKELKDKLSNTVNSQVNEVKKKKTTLTSKQHKLDINKDGKLSKDDFYLLRKINDAVNKAKKKKTSTK